ncbi:MAG: T9SS type A sorting domain-containing protein [Bacteroidetes bacterium]|nr:T9SS type A sorting domain-containing protein [Bacteroidota bacterium]
MKKLLFLIAFINLALESNCQLLQLDIQNTTSNYAPVKLSKSGTKYYLLDATQSWTVMEQTMQLKLYNLDETIFKTMSLPAKPDPSAVILAIYYVSESLFDTDSSNVEYMICWYWSGGSKIQVVRENGTILLSENNAYTVEMWTTGKYISVFQTEVGTKLQLAYSVPSPNGYIQQGSKIFILPGSYPAGIGPMARSGPVDLSLYPNPNFGEFNIEGVNSVSLDLEFYSEDGRKIKTVNVGPDMHVKNLGLSNGVYLVNIKNPKTKQSTTKKIIIE